jgi:uncharacterized BrkB/YihY/UPF0761 family membrane protein
MERFWNFIHYFIYKLDYRFHILFNKINPIFYFYKLPYAKKHFEKMGIDPVIEVNKAFKRSDFGISSIRAGGFMYILVFIICFGLVNLFCALIQINIRLRLYHFIIFVIVSLIINYFLLFQQNKYLVYFNEFESLPKEEKIKWAWISLAAIIGIVCFFIGSFFYKNYRL